MRKTILILSVSLFALAAWAPASDAGPAWGRHKKKYKRKYEEKNEEKYEVSPFGKMVVRETGGPLWRKGGPPPWAPAHGYRRKAGSRVAYSPPYGIGSGRCDRSQIGEVLGGVLGGVAGGVIGSQIGKGDGKTIATIGGAIIGYLVGSAVGQDLDRVDHACVGQALEHAETHRTVAWRNPDSGRSYEVTPTNIYKNDGGEYCREYTSVSTIDGRTRKVYGRACRRPDGTWRLIN